MGSYSGCCGEGSRAALLGTRIRTHSHVQPLLTPPLQRVADAILEDEVPSHFRPCHHQRSSDPQHGPCCRPRAPEDTALTPRLASQPRRHLQGSGARPADMEPSSATVAHSPRAPLWPPLATQFTQNSKISCFKFHSGFVSPRSQSPQGPRELNCVCTAPSLQKFGRLCCLTD